MDGLTYRRGGPEDYDALLDLYQCAYGKSFSRAWLRWWNEEGPVGNGLRLACDGPRVVGAYGLMPLEVVLSGARIKASLCNNVCVHPALQGQGIFTSLGLYSLAGEVALRVPLAVGFPNAKALPGHLKVGWDVLCELGRLVKGNCEHRGHACEVVDSFDTRLDYLHRRLALRYAFLVAKDCHWLNWRLKRHGATYTRFIAPAGNEIAGYAVLKKYLAADGRTLAHICDLMAETHEALDALLVAAEDYAADCDELDALTTPNDPFFKVLCDAGFVGYDTGEKMIVRTNYGDHLMPDPEQPWHVCRLDNDVY